jgi:hypothetical protein
MNTREGVGLVETGVDPGLRPDDVSLWQPASFLTDVMPAKVGVHASVHERDVWWATGAAAAANGGV